jgi:hypothetical protein
MTKTMMGMVVMGFALVGGCASGGSLEQRGSMVIAPDTVRAFAAGPAVVHAFSMDGGGRVFVATAKTRTDADCAAAAATTSAADVAVDQRNVVTLAPGQVACVAANDKHAYELMWHARPVEASSGPYMIAQAQR